MDKVLNTKQVVKVAQGHRAEGKRMVLVGGCFDILHLGHAAFLEKAKEKGDLLLVLLEPDETVRRLKGEGRPINAQMHRAQLLSHIDLVDYVVVLPQMRGDEEYDELVLQIRPDVIATTGGDKFLHHKKRQGELVGAEVLEVVGPVAQQSTTEIAKKIFR